MWVQEPITSSSLTWFSFTSIDVRLWKSTLFPYPVACVRTKRRDSGERRKKWGNRKEPFSSGWSEPLFVSVCNSQFPPLFWVRYRWVCEAFSTPTIAFVYSRVRWFFRRDTTVTFFLSLLLFSFIIFSPLLNLSAAHFRFPSSYYNVGETRCSMGNSKKQQLYQ